MTAGHNALRGSGPGQKLAFDNAVAQMGCLITDYAVEQLRLNGNNPATVVVPGFDRTVYPAGL